MKKLFLFIFFVLFSVNVFAFYSKTIDDNHIYFFSQSTCPHCQHAIQYISQNYPNLDIIYKDIREDSENYKEFLEGAKKFNINKNELGTPLICIGQEYVLGWSEENQKKFDECVKKFVESE